MPGHVLQSARIADKPKLVDYRNSFNEIVKDLINNWQSPIVYLKSRGYLPKGLDDDSQLMGDAVEVPDNFNVREKHIRKKSSKMLRKQMDGGISKRSNEAESLMSCAAKRNMFDRMKNIFHQLLESPDNSKHLEQKLGVELDIDQWKYNAKKEATKFYEEMLKKLIHKGSDVVPIPSSEDKSISQDIVVPLQSPNFLHWDLKTSKLKYGVSKDQYLDGIVKAFSKKSKPTGKE